MACGGEGRDPLPAGALQRRSGQGGEGSRPEQQGQQRFAIDNRGALSRQVVPSPALRGCRSRRSSPGYDPKVLRPGARGSLRISLSWEGGSGAWPKVRSGCFQVAIPAGTLRSGGFLYVAGDLFCSHPLPF